MLPNADAWSRSLSGFACQKRGCGKIEMWIKAGKCPDCEEGSCCAFIWCFFSIVRSCLIRGNPSSPEHWAIFRFTLTWPHVNTPMLILYSLFSYNPSPHTHAYLPSMFSHALIPQLLTRLTFIEMYVMKWCNWYSWFNKMLQWHLCISQVLWKALWVSFPKGQCSYSRNTVHMQLAELEAIHCCWNLILLCFFLSLIVS